MRILSYYLMPNHWHFIHWPENDGDLGQFMQRLTDVYSYYHKGLYDVF